jgi:uncharacterized membrane-anchored protein YjiN (DUF445 family)
MSLDAAADETSGDRHEAQRAGLERMRLAATGLLFAMLFLSILCTVGKAHAAWLGYPAAFAEAATVGACADWFAVTALFRHPLGLPIPHTAILPRNQQRLAESAGVFIARNFLSAREVAPRLERIDLAGWAADWLKRPDHADLIAACCRALISPAIEAAGAREMREHAAKLIHEGLESVAAAPLASRVLGAILDYGYDNGLYDFGVEKAADFLKDNRKAIRQKASEGRSGWLGGWVDAKAADSFVTALQDSLMEATAPDHPWRRRFHEYLVGLADRLADDPQTVARWEKLKVEALSAERVDQILDWLIGEAQTRLKAEFDSGSGGMTRGVEHGLAAVGRWLEQDEPARARINRWTREAVLNTLVPNRAEIGAFVTDVISRWDSATLVERFELYVGRDLQFIRINGAVVGGCVGLAIYTVTQVVTR